MAEENQVQLNDKLQKIATDIESLTVLELADLSKYLEEKFGVSAMPMMAAGAPAAGAADAEPAEEKTTFDVVLAEAGANKLAVIKAVREVRPDLGLMDAKKLVEEAPKDILTGVKKDEAEAAQKKIQDAGGKADLK